MRSPFNTPDTMLAEPWAVVTVRAPGIFTTCASGVQRISSSVSSGVSTSTTGPSMSSSQRRIHCTMPTRNGLL